MYFFCLSFSSAMRVLLFGIIVAAVIGAETITFGSQLRDLLEKAKQKELEDSYVRTPRYPDLTMDIPLLESALRLSSTGGHECYMNHIQQLAPSWEREHGAKKEAAERRIDAMKLFEKAWREKHACEDVSLNWNADTGEMKFCWAGPYSCEYNKHNTGADYSYTVMGAFK
jgi:hypothetical protein